MASGKATSEKVKRTALAGLGVVFLIAIVYQLFLSGPATKPKRPLTTNTSTSVAPTNTNSSINAPQKRQLGAAAQQEALMQALLSDTTPLNLRTVSAGAGKAELGERGNIFAYYVPPPAPPPKPPDPPPIQLRSVQPSSAVAGTPKPVNLVVTGNKIPADAQILIDGAPKPTKRVSDSQLSAVLAPSDYSSARGMNIKVVSQSNPKEDSNVLQFVVQAAPEPQFVFRGRLGALNQPASNYALVEITSTKEIKRVKVGETVLGIWRVDAISADAMEITLVQNDIKRRVPLQDKVR
jgi:hypothetical protein